MGFKDSSFYRFPRLFNQAFGSYKLQIAGITVLSFTNSLLEGIGISTIIPIFSFAAKGGAKSTDFISQTIEKFFTYLHIGFTLRALLVFIVILFIVKVFVLFSVRYITARVTTNYQTNSQISIFTHIMQADWPHLSAQKLGHLDQILTTNISRVGTLFFCFSTLVIIVAKIVIYTAVAANISLGITLLTFAVGIISFFIIKPLFYRSKRLAGQAEVLNRETSHYTNENVLGMKTVKSMLAAKPIIAKAGRYFTTMRRLNMGLVIAEGTTDMLVQTVGIGFVMILFIFFYKATAFNFAIFAVMIYAINQIFLQIQSVQTQLHRVIGLIPYVTSVSDFKDEAKLRKEVDDGRDDFKFQHSLVFDEVSFAYGASGREVLQNISFNIKKGEMVGLIGPSGAGKTTVVDLLLRFFKPQKGHILLDGKNIDQIRMSAWRTNIGYVAQDMFLINDTIANNIRFYDETLTDNDIESAARMANIHDFIEDCPEKFNTIIGERGILLSMGQRQRIIIARVLARQPEFLILDEATSALDNESEIQIQRVIENLKGKVTVLVIAHRLSTVINSDKLVVIEAGQVKESGSPSTLLKNEKSYFSKVYNLRE